MSTYMSAFIPTYIHVARQCLHHVYIHQHINVVPHAQGGVHDEVFVFERDVTTYDEVFFLERDMTTSKQTPDSADTGAAIKILGASPLPVWFGFRGSGVVV